MNLTRAGSSDSMAGTISPTSTTNSEQNLQMLSPTEANSSSPNVQEVRSSDLSQYIKSCSDQNLETGRKLWDLFEQRFESRLEQIEKKNALLHRHYFELYGTIHRLEKIVGNILSNNNNNNNNNNNKQNQDEIKLIKPILETKSGIKRLRLESEDQANHFDYPDGESISNSMPFQQNGIKPFVDIILQLMRTNNACNQKSHMNSFSISQLARSQENDNNQHASTPIHLVQNIISGSNPSLKNEMVLNRKDVEDETDLRVIMKKTEEFPSPQQSQQSSPCNPKKLHPFDDQSFNFAGFFAKDNKNSLFLNNMNEIFQRKLAFKRDHTDAIRNRRCSDFGMGRRCLMTSSVNNGNSRVSNLCERPAVILNPIEPREMFVGGVHTVKLPVWAYRKCLGMVRGAPHELGPRLCLRLLQSLFSLNYLVTHNYNGSGGKTPIDPTVMSAVLQQAQLQFGSDHFFTEPMALGKLRDYLNNAFRVMAFRQRKGERVRSPFWNEQGEPVLPLDPPIGYNMNNSVTGCIQDVNNSSHGFFKANQIEANIRTVIDG